jgi:N-glycosylase/DNA lyase
MLFVDLAEALILEEKYDMALNVLDKMMEKIPSTATKHDYLSIQPAMAYYSLGEEEKGKDILTEVADNSMEYMTWFRGLEIQQVRSISQEYLRHEYTLKTIIKFFVQQGDEESARKYLYALDELGYNLFKES